MDTKRKGYFSLAFYDVIESPGWVGKCALLALILMVPVFGIIVVLGYLFGWARDIAWHVHRPLPSRIFGNEDGSLYKRGAQLLAIMVIYVVVAYIVQEILSLLILGNVAVLPFTFALNNGLVTLSFLSAISKWGLYSLGSFVIACAFAVVSWIAMMRSSLYGTFTSAFQPARLAELIKQDFPGLLKILGMAIIVSLMTGLIAVVISFAIVMLCGIITAVTSVTPLVVFAIFFVVVVIIAIVIVAFMTQVFTLAMVIRAMGYWFGPLNVAAWGSQDSPLPARSAYASHG